MKIVVDVDERQSGVPDALRDLGWTVDFEHLPTGDYAIDDLALIERKTVRGLHLTLIEGRLWSQIGRLRRAVPWPYLLLEGTSLYEDPLSPEAVRGLLISVGELGVTVIYACDAVDAAAWIARVALRRRGNVRNVNRPPYAQRAQRAALDPPPERALAAAAGVSTVTARRLLGEFGTLRDVLLAEPEELRRVRGVGLHRAIAIRELATSTSDSGVSRNCVSPST
ncbi:MAG TPA: ERCC4 domain-containing protein [Gaiellaceae bacterium]|nr:ERCC4 domain-containing protein [Gaiellaceae bacterium]